MKTSYEQVPTCMLLMISGTFSVLWITINRALIMNHYVSVLTCIVCVFPLLVTPYANIVPARVQKWVIICFAEQIRCMLSEI